MKAVAVKFRQKWDSWMLLTSLVLPVLASGIWYGRLERQQYLDHALILAIKKQDTKAAIALLNQGANANATDRPYTPITLTTLFADFWRRVKGQAPAKDTKLYPSA